MGSTWCQVGWLIFVETSNFVVWMCPQIVTNRWIIFQSRVKTVLRTVWKCNLKINYFSHISRPKLNLNPFKIYEKTPLYWKSDVWILVKTCIVTIQNNMENSSKIIQNPSDIYQKRYQNQWKYVLWVFGAESCPGRLWSVFRTKAGNWKVVFFF